MSIESKEELGARVDLLLAIGRRQETAKAKGKNNLVRYSLKKEIENAAYDYLETEGLVRTVHGSYDPLTEESIVNCQLTHKGTTMYQAIEECYRFALERMGNHLGKLVTGSRPKKEEIFS